MKWCKGLLMVVMLALIVPMAGCCGGTSKETTHTVVEKQPVIVTPLGDELLKLKEAHESGALSDEEYEAAKAKLLQGQKK